MVVLGIDPGTDRSGVVVMDVESGSIIGAWGGFSNESLLRALRRGVWIGEWLGLSPSDSCKSKLCPDVNIDMVFIETIEAMGQIIGNATIGTAIWVGEFKEAWRRSRGEGATWLEDSSCVRLVRRGDEKNILCGGTTLRNPKTGRRQGVSDANIRAAVMDRFPATGGGKTPQKGTKGVPGPLYGVSSHAWSALAVAITGLEIIGHKSNWRDVAKEKGER